MKALGMPAALALVIFAMMSTGDIPRASAQEPGARAATSRKAAHTRRGKQARNKARQTPAAREARKARDARDAREAAVDAAGERPDQASAMQARDAQAKPSSHAASAASAATTDAADAADVRKEGDTEVKVLEFSGLDIEGQLKTPQMLYFLNRLRAEFDRPQLPHRSFIPELQRATQEKAF